MTNQRAARVNERAHDVDQDPAFAQRIREELPLPERLGVPERHLVRGLD